MNALRLLAQGFAGSMTDASDSGQRRASTEEEGAIERSGAGRSEPMDVMSAKLYRTAGERVRQAPNIDQTSLSQISPATAPAATAMTRPAALRLERC